MDQNDSTCQIQEKICCEHEFEFSNEISNPCLKNNKITTCLKCKGVHFDLVIKAFFKYFEKPFDEIPKDAPFCHFHIWTKDGSCSSELFYNHQINEENYSFDETGNISLPNSNRKCNAKRGE